MTSSTNPYLPSRTNILFYEPMQFQRGRETPKIRKKRKKKKISLRFIHISFFFISLVCIFYFLQQCFLFLFSWDYLNIKNINVICAKEEIRKEIHDLLENKRLPNILLVDISRLQNLIETNQWVKEVRVKKTFPDSLSIEVKEKEPVAVLKKENLFLIDEQGTQLEKISSKESHDFPFLLDSNNFQKHNKEKLLLAWGCLKNLPSSVKEDIKALDLTYFGWVTLYLKNERTKVILSYDNFAQEIKFFLNCHNNLEKRFGALEYVDLRFKDRLYIKPLISTTRSGIPNPNKEAL